MERKTKIALGLGAIASVVTLGIGFLSGTKSGRQQGYQAAINTLQSIEREIGERARYQDLNEQDRFLDYCRSISEASSVLERERRNINFYLDSR